MIGVRGEEAGCEEAKRHPSPISPHHDLQCPASSRITPHRPASPASMSDNAYTDRRGTACGCPQRPALLPIAPQCPAMPCNVCIHHPCRTMHAPIVGAPLVGDRSASPRSASPRIAHNAHIARIAPRAGGGVPPSGGRAAFGRTEYQRPGYSRDSVRAAESRLLAGGRAFAFGRTEDGRPGYSRDSQ